MMWRMSRTETFEKACRGVFAEPPVDILYQRRSFRQMKNDRVFSVEFLPGQFDQRADSAEQCVRFIKGRRGAGDPHRHHLCDRGKHYQTRNWRRSKNTASTRWIPERQRMEKPETLVTVFEEPEDVKIFDGFCRIWMKTAFKGAV